MNHFDAKIFGASLVEAGRNIIPTEQADVQALWYHSPLDADLFLWRDPEQSLLKVQIMLLGQVVEWNIIDGVKTGVIFEREWQGAPVSEEVRFDKVPISRALQQAIELLGHVQFLSAPERQDILLHLQESPAQFRARQDQLMQRFYSLPSVGPWRRLIAGLMRVLHRLRNWF